MATYFTTLTTSTLDSDVSSKNISVIQKCDQIQKERMNQTDFSRRSDH